MSAMKKCDCGCMEYPRIPQAKEGEKTDARENAPVGATEPEETQVAKKKAD